MNYTMASMYGVKSMRINKLIIQETGTYSQQWKRPYISGLNPKTFNSIVEKSSNAKTITPNILAGVSTQFIHPTATPEGTLFIPNGWQERRLRFFMEVCIEEQMGCIVTEYIVGYTDYAGIGRINNSIDPEMRFHINGINTTRNMTHVTALGTQTYQNAIDSSHVLSNTNYTNIQNSVRTYSMRPEDVYMQMDVADIQKNQDLGDFIDVQSLITTVPIKSKRTNSIAPVYVANILDAYIKAKPLDFHESNRGDILQTAIGINSSNSVSDDQFMSFLRNRNNNNGDSFTYNDLIAIDQNIFNVTQVVQLTPITKATVHQAGSTSEWGAADMETAFATCISQSLPGYMLECCFNKFFFRATNRDIGGKISIVISEAKSLMSNVDTSDYIRVMEFKLENELFKDLTFNNQMDFAIDVRCDLLFETWINLSINSGPFTTYVTPSFCDALMSPVITDNYNNCLSIASDFSNIVDTICDNKNSTQQMSNKNGFGLI